MDREKHLQLILEKGLMYGPVVKQFFIDEYENLNLPILLKNRIGENLISKQNFEISLSELRTIIPLVENKIAILLSDSSFDPFKEDLRKKYPEQYSSNPFKYNNITYYLHPKGFEIDSLINRANNFKEIIERHVKLNKNLKFVYKK